MTLGSFTCHKSMTWDSWLYFPSEGSHTQDFYALKNPSTPAGFEPVNIVPVLSMITTGPPGSTWNQLNGISFIIFHKRKVLSTKYKNCYCNLHVYSALLAFNYLKIFLFKILISPIRRINACMMREILWIINGYTQGQ